MRRARRSVVQQRSRYASQWKKRTRGDTQHFQVSLQAWQWVEPWKVARYADLAEYTPFAVHFQCRLSGALLRLVWAIKVPKAEVFADLRDANRAMDVGSPLVCV